jgi:hypothetical protein
MVTLRCTASFLKRLGPPEPEAAPTRVLGDWYSKVITTRPRHLALCINERSLLVVAVPVAPISAFLDRFASAARNRINQIAAGADKRLSEIGAFADIRVGRTANRSVLSSLNEFAFLAQHYLAAHPDGDLEELGLFLCETPCSPLQTDWPWLEAELLLTGAVASDSRGHRFPRRVI